MLFQFMNLPYIPFPEIAPDTKAPVLTMAEEADVAAKINLSQEEMSVLETLAETTDVNTKGSWENPMV